MIRILQISDIHWEDKLGANDAYKEIRDGMINDLKCYCEAENDSFDHVLICGDIAFSGAKAQYERAGKFIKKLCETVGCKESEVYIIPGNHDKKRESAPQTVRNLINNAVGEKDFGDDMLEDWIQNDFSSLRIMFMPFKDFVEFSQKFDCVEPLMMRCTDEKATDSYDEDKHTMFWREDICLDLNGYIVRLYGLNSALNCDKEDWDALDETKGHKIFLPNLAYRNAPHEEGVVNILMAHHPTSFLVNGMSIQKYLDKHYQVQFFGHVHRAKSNCKNGCVHVFSGALQPDGPVQQTGPYRPVFNMVELDIVKQDDQTDMLNVKLQVHVWTDGSFQINKEESDLYKVELKHNRWKGGLNVMSKTTLPDGITKRDIRRKMIEKPSARTIINKMKPGFYDSKVPSYYNIARFMDEISKENKWVDLWNEIK